MPLKRGVQQGLKRAVLVGGIQQEDCGGAIVELRIEKMWSLYLIRGAEGKGRLIIEVGDMRVPLKHGKIDNRQDNNLGTGRKV